MKYKLMRYTKGQIVNGTINKISSNGVYIEFENSDGYGFLPTYFMTDIENGNILLKKHQKISFAIEKIKDEDRKFYIVSQTRYSKIIQKVEQERLKETQLQLFNTIVSAITPGDVFECKIIKSSTNRIQLDFNGYDNVFVEKDEIAWGNQDAKNQSFCDGQIVDAVFLYGDRESRILFFSLKRLRKNPYDEDLYSFDTEKLLAFLGIKKNLFVGKCVRKSDSLFFLTDIIAYNNQQDDDLEGELLINPYTGENLKALFRTSDVASLVDGNYYQVTIVVAPAEYRRNKNEPFVFGVSTFSDFEYNPYKHIVDEVFKKSDNPHSNTTIARLLEEVGKQMYSSKDRTFFELLQNADDAAAPKSENSVEVVVQAKDGYLFFCHNGCAFNRSDFISISSAANSTKRKLGNKTGYKGIGFKSVFSDADSVHLLSRGFNIKFEKNNPIFEDFHNFYYKARNCRSEEEYKRLMAPFRDDEKNFRGISDMPWQILPLWEDCKEVFSSVEGDYNVCIGIKTSVVNLYEKSIVELTKQPEFLLFLRNTKRLYLFGKVLEKSITLGKIVLRSDSQTKRYLKKDFSDILITNEEFSKYPNIHLHIQEVHNSTTGEKEFHFFENGQDKSSTIPNKLAESGVTTISFVSHVEGEFIIPKEIGNASSPLFAYLPTSDKRFPFPFFVNADFVLSSNRESIQGDNPWNVYLFAKIAEYLVIWVSEIASVYQPDYLNLLISDLLDIDSSDTKLLASSFNQAYKDALASERFILDDLGNKVSSNQIIIDSSKLSSFLSDDSFYSLIGTHKRLPNSALNVSILEKDIFGIEKLTRAKIYKILTENIENVRTWISSTDDELQRQFFTWLALDEDNTEIVSLMPLIQFGNQWLSIKELINKDNYIVSSLKTIGIKDVLSKLGFVCSDTIIDTHPLAGNITTMEEKTLFALIKDKETSLLSFQDRLRLVECCEHFDNVGEAAIANWTIFKNQEGSFVKMASMVAYSEDIPKWLHSYMLNKDEYSEKLNKFLVKDDSILSTIVEPNISEILSGVDVYEIYSYFKNRWTNDLTLKLIKLNVSNIISLVEVNPETHKTYIQSLNELSLSSSAVYSDNTQEYKIIKIASSDTCCINLLRSKITIDGIALSSISLKDEFHVQYNHRKYEFHLSKILTTHSDSLKLSDVAKNFSNIANADSIFAQNEANPMDVYGNLFSSTVTRCAQLNVEQFCFLMLIGQSSDYNKISFSALGKYIRVGDEQWFLDIMDYCYDNELGDALYLCLKTQNIIYPCGSLIGKFIDSDDYTLVSERVPIFISNWADSNEKKNFLKKLGVHGEESNDIQRRVSFKTNKFVNEYWNISDSKIIRLFFDWIKNSIELPVTGENQITILEKLFDVQRINREYREEDFVDSSEWTNELYLAWKKDSGVSIKIISGLLPYCGIYAGVHYFSANCGEYIYFKESNTIYISSNKEPASILTDVYADRTISVFNQSDWNKIFLVSANLIKDKDDEIAELKKIIEDLSLQKDNTCDSEVENHGNKYSRGNLPPEQRKQVNLEACESAYNYLRDIDGYDCSEWDYSAEGRVVKSVLYNGRQIVVVITSSSGGYIHLNPYAFAQLMENPENLLINVCGNKVRTYSFKELFEENPDVNLIFDSKVVTPKNFAELANKFLTSERTCFVVANPNYSASDEIKGFGLNEKMEGGKVITFLSDDQIW